MTARRPTKALTVRRRRDKHHGDADRAAGACGRVRCGEATQATDRGLAGIGALGRGEIVEHAMTVIGAEDDLPVGRTPRVLLKQRLQQESTCSAQTRDEGTAAKARATAQNKTLAMM